MKTNAEKRACERHSYTAPMRFHISLKNIVLRCRPLTIVPGACVLNQISSSNPERLFISE